MNKILALLIAAFIAVPAAASTAREDAAAAALAFYRYYAGGDLDGALAFWSPQSPSAPLLRSRSQRLLRTHCFELGRLEAVRADVAGDDAAVDVEAEWLDTPVMPGALPFADFADGKVALHREAGQWRIVEWTPAAATFAEVIATGDDAARAAALANPRIRCRAAVREIARRSITALNQGRMDLARPVADTAERLAWEIGDGAALVCALATKSIIERLSGHWTLARIACDSSLLLLQRWADPNAFSRAMLACGSVAGVEHFEHLLALRDSLSDAALIAIGASRMAQVYNDSGDYWTGLQYSFLSLRYAQESNDAAAVINAEINIAATYGAYRDPALSLSHFMKIIAVAERAGFTNHVSDGYLDAAGQEIEMGQYKRARALLDHVTDPTRRLRYLVVRARCEPDPAAAETYLVEAARIAETSTDGIGKLEAFRQIIRVELDLGRPAAALPYVRRVGELDGDHPPVFALFEDKALEAETERRLGHTEAALRAINTAIGAAERERAHVLGDERQQRSFSAGRLRVYGELVTIRVAAGQALSALSASDDAKGRTLLDLLRSKRATFDDVMSADERRQEHELRARAAAVRRQTENAAGTARAELTDQLEHSRTDIDAFEAALAAKYPRAIPTWSPPAAITEETLRELLPDTKMAIVEFMVTRDRLHAFVARRDAAGRVRVLVRSTPMKTATLRRRVSRFVAALARADLDYRADGRKLYDLLLAPLAPRLDGARVVCIVPDGPLWQLPFEALVAPDGRFFVERAVPFYVPSIAVYARMRVAEGTRGDGTLFALADPHARRTPNAVVSRLRAGETSPLPDAEREVRAAARILGGRTAVYVGADASIRRLQEEGAAYRVLHFATHGVLDDLNPMYSHLVFAPAATATTACSTPGR